MQRGVLWAVNHAAMQAVTDAAAVFSTKTAACPKKFAASGVHSGKSATF